MAQPDPKSPSSDDGNEPYTEDGWTFEDVKKFENILNEFDDPPPPEFFQQVAYEMPWKTMESIKFHYELLMRDLSIICDPDFEVIFDEAEDHEQSVDSESENDNGNDDSSE